AGLPGGNAESLRLADTAANARIVGQPPRDSLDRSPDDTAELLSLESMEFPCAAGDEDTAGARVDAVADVAGQQVEVDFAGLGERGDREEQNATKRGAHRWGLLDRCFGGQSRVSRPSMRRHR